MFKISKNAVRLFSAVTLCAVVLSGCGDKSEIDESSAKAAETDSVSQSSAAQSEKSESELLAPFIGDWQARESFAESDEWYTGYLHFYVLEDGKYSMYDNEAGNPGITGHFSQLTEDSVVFEDESDVDFDPPPNWEDMSRNQKISYKFSSENTLEFTYENGSETWTLIFDREMIYEE